MLIIGHVSYSRVANDDRKFYAITDKDASRKKVVTFTLPTTAEWTPDPLKVEFEDFIPEDSNGGILVGFGPVNHDVFVLQYSRNVRFQSS